MKKFPFRILLGSLGTLALVFPQPVRAAYLFPGHRTFSPQAYSWAGRHPASVPMRLSIALSLRDPEGLQTFLRELYDPQSPQYRRFLTSAQFADRFGPTPLDYQELQDRLASQGLKVTSVFSNRMMLDVEGPTDAVERVFHVRINDFRREDGRLFFGPDQDPSLDQGAPIVHVGGLDNAEKPRPRLRKFPRNPSPRAGGSGIGGAFLGSDFRNAYAPGVTLTGSGQSLALVEFAVYTPADITTYEGKCTPTLSVPVSNIYLGGFTSTTSPDCKAADGYPEIEVALDIEVAMAMAPGLDRVIVYMESGTALDVLNHIASDNDCRQISCSWGWSLSSSDRTAQNNTLSEFAAQGQSYFLASGDGNPSTGVGAFTTDPPYGGNPSTNTNANDGLILQTTVGATDLTMSGGSWAGEVPIAISHGWQSTGGILAGTRTGDSQSLYASYQGGINMTANFGSTIYRNVPDVSCAGLNCYVYDCTGDDNVGGTSAATPLWAAYMALVNQKAALAGKGPVGFPNPSLYSIAKGANYAADFHDITTGNNGSVTQFPAVAGYDLATGWGTPKGQSLIDDLVAWIPTATPTSTSSRTNTVTPTFSPTLTPTQTLSVTPTGTPTATASKTGTSTATNSATATATGTPTSTPTNTASATSSSTATLTPTPTSTNSPTRTATWTSTNSATSTLTHTASETATSSMTSTASLTASQTPTSSATPSPTDTFTRTATLTLTSTLTDTASATASSTATRTATQTSTDTSTPTSTATPTSTPTDTASATASSTATLTPTPTHSPTGTATSTLTNSATYTATGTATSSMTPTASLTASQTPTSSETLTPTATSTDSSTRTATFTPTLTPTDTASSTASSTATRTQTSTGTDSATPTASPTSTNSPTSTATSTFSGAATSTVSFTPTATASRTATFTATLTATPTIPFTPLPLFTFTPTSSPTFTQTSVPSSVFSVKVQPNVGDGTSPFQFTVTLAEAGTIYWAIYDLAGERIRESTMAGVEGTNIFLWDGKNRNGERIASGVYIYYVQAGDGTGGKKAAGKILIRH